MINEVMVFSQKTMMLILLAWNTVTDGTGGLIITNLSDVASEKKVDIMTTVTFCFVFITTVQPLKFRNG